jgi:hypothetical protein
VLNEAEARLAVDIDPARPVPFYRFLRNRSQLDYI